MIIAFCDDSTIELYESEAEAIVAFEGIDVESGVVAFFRDDGTYLAPRFVVPNRTGKHLWLFAWSESGTYVLEPAPGQSEDPLWLLLVEHQDLEPRFGISTVSELKTHLAARGAAVEQP